MTLPHKTPSCALLAGLMLTLSALSPAATSVWLGGINYPASIVPQDVAATGDLKQLLVHSESSTAQLQRYSISSTGALQVMQPAVAITQLGHQGISVESHRVTYAFNVALSQTVMWGSSTNPRKAIRFSFNTLGRFCPSPTYCYEGTSGSSAPVSTRDAASAMQTYTLFGAEYAGYPGSMPKVCRGTRMLMARGRLADESAEVLRIFDLDRLINNGPGDYSAVGNYTQVRLPDSVIPKAGNDGSLQGYDCDQNGIYLVSGSGSLSRSKLFHRLTRTGAGVYTTATQTYTPQAAFPTSEAPAGTSLSWLEPEGLFLWRAQSDLVVKPYLGFNAIFRNATTGQTYRKLYITGPASGFSF